MRDIKTVTVIGAGAMGGGIAAQLSNAGIKVNLVNIAWDGQSGEEIAQDRINEMKKAKLASDPLNAAFMDPSNARLVTPVSQETGLDAAVAESDWVIEVIVENLKVKQGLFEQIEKAMKPGTIISSNTSTIPLSSLIEGRSDEFKENFVITHFFNPPHIMRLLEIVQGDATDEVAETLRDFCDRKMGKDVRFCNDTPAMMANRIGVYMLFRAVAEAFEKDAAIEDVDAALGKAMGFPKDGIFGLLDLVGIQLVPHLAESLNESLPESDAFRQIDGDDVMTLTGKMLSEGRWGRRSGKGGFYDMKKDENGKRTKLALDLRTDTYRESTKPSTSILTKVKNEFGLSGLFDLSKAIPVEDLTAEYKNLNREHLQIMDTLQTSSAADFINNIAKATGKDAPYDHGVDVDGLKGKLESLEKDIKKINSKLDAARLSEFAWPVMRDVLLYAVSLVPDVTDNIDDIDQSMRAGYNWKRGPFQLLDDIGHDWFAARLAEDGIDLPPILQLAGNEPFYKAIDGKQNHMTFDFDSGTIGYEPNFTPEGVVNLHDVKRSSEPLITHNSASLWDIGDGVVCLELHSKMNSMDPSILYVTNEAIKLVNSSDQYSSMVVYQGDDRFRSEGGAYALDDDNFSFGANLSLIDHKYEMAKHKFRMINDAMTVSILKKLKVPEKTAKAFHAKLKPLCENLDDRNREQRLTEYYNEVSDLIYYGQSVYKALREAPFPVVGAAAGMAFGGGCEFLLHCNAVQTHALFIPGLVEAGVGVIPAWGGTTRVMAKAQEAQKAGVLPQGPFVTSKTAFQVISMPQFSMAFTAEEAKKKMWLAPTDGISMNRERVLSDAKERAVSMVPGFEPPKPATFFLNGESAATAFKSGVDDFDTQGMLTHYDVVVADALGDVVSGGRTNPSKELTESDVLNLEREAFMSLIKTQGTVDRIKHMLATNKPLREKPLDQPLSTKELRATRAFADVAKREVTGQPLTGVDAEKLEKQAKGTRKFYDLGRKMGLI